MDPPSGANSVSLASTLTDRGRRYDAGWGRYAQPDPLSFKKDLFGLREASPSYDYAGDDPINYQDPTGLLTCDCQRRLKPFKKRFSVFYHEYLRIGPSLNCKDNTSYGFFPADEVAGTPLLIPGKTGKKEGRA